jgi:hypothetical protein
MRRVRENHKEEWKMMLKNLPMSNLPDKGGMEWQRSSRVGREMEDEVVALARRLAEEICRHNAMDVGEEKKIHFNGWLNTIIRYTPLRFF